MTRTEGHGTNGQPVTGPGAEWWGKRPKSYTVKGSKRFAGWFKRELHKAERRERRSEERDARIVHVTRQYIHDYGPYGEFVTPLYDSEVATILDAVDQEQVT